MVEEPSTTDKSARPQSKVFTKSSKSLSYYACIFPLLEYSSINFACSQNMQCLRCLISLDCFPLCTTVHCMISLLFLVAASFVYLFLVPSAQLSPQLLSLGTCL